MNKFNKTPSKHQRTGSAATTGVKPVRQTRRSSQISQEADKFIRMANINDNQYNQQHHFQQQRILPQPRYTYHQEITRNPQISQRLSQERPEKKHFIERDRMLEKAWDSYTRVLDNKQPQRQESVLKSMLRNRSTCDISSASDVQANYQQVWQQQRQPYKSPFVRTKPAPVQQQITAAVSKKEPKSGKKIYPELDFKRQTPNLISHNENTIAQYQRERPVTAFVGDRQVQFSRRKSDSSQVRLSLSDHYQSEVVNVRQSLTRTPSEAVFMKSIKDFDNLRQWEEIKPLRSPARSLYGNQVLMLS